MHHREASPWRPSPPCGRLCSGVPQGQEPRPETSGAFDPHAGGGVPHAGHRTSRPSYACHAALRSSAPGSRVTRSGCNDPCSEVTPRGTVPVRMTHRGRRCGRWMLPTVPASALTSPADHCSGPYRDPSGSSSTARRTHGTCWPSRILCSLGARPARPPAWSGRTRRPAPSRPRFPRTGGQGPPFDEQFLPQRSAQTAAWAACKASQWRPKRRVRAQRRLVLPLPARPARRPADTAPDSAAHPLRPLPHHRAISRAP